jgi:hypothetical protein
MPALKEISNFLQELDSKPTGFWNKLKIYCKKDKKPGIEMYLLLLVCSGKLCLRKVKKKVNFVEKDLQCLTRFLLYIILV